MKRKEFIEFLYLNGIYNYNDDAVFYDEVNHEMDNSALSFFSSSSRSPSERETRSFCAILYSSRVEDYILVFFDEEEDCIKWFHLGEDLYEFVVEEIGGS